MPSLNEKIFRAYDIRGIYPDDLDEKAAYQIGRAFAAYLLESEAEKPEKIIIGRDPRISSPILARAFINGVIDAGLDVLDIGMVTVDAVYFASGSMHLPAAMITASHNPKEYNGFKLMKKNVGLMGLDSGLNDIKKIIEGKQPLKSRKGAIVEKSVESEYLKHVLSFTEFDYIRPMRIAIDASSGSVGPVLKKVLEKLPIEYKPLNFKPDGDFPSHDPDPTKEKNLEDLKTEIKTGNHYSFGCAIDGDGDRIIFIDENGDVISSSIMGAIMAKYFLKNNRGAKIVYGATVGKIVFDAVNAYGGIPLRERVGHTFIQRRLREENGIFGIETSGHYYFDDHFYSDSAVISFLTVLNILSSQNKRISVLAAEFNKYIAIPETSFNVENPDEFIKKIAQNFEGYETDWLDGLTVRTSDFWLNLRPSNTEPLVRLNIEAKNELILERVKRDVIDLINKFKK
jgi:phosphomannomutase